MPDDIFVEGINNVDIFHALPENNTKISKDSRLFFPMKSQSIK